MAGHWPSSRKTGCLARLAGAPLGQAVPNIPRCSRAGTSALRGPGCSAGDATSGGSAAAPPAAGSRAAALRLLATPTCELRQQGQPVRTLTPRPRLGSGVAAHRPLPRSLVAMCGLKSNR